MGVDPSQLAVASAGCEGTAVKLGSSVVDLYDARNVGAGGSWNEAVARKNRTIVLVPAALADDVLKRFSVSG